MKTNYNYEALKVVYDQITKEPYTFNMKTWCGTTKCVAGWTCHFYDPDNCYKEHYDEGEYFEETAARILNFTGADTELFFQDKNEIALQIIEALVMQAKSPKKDQLTVSQLIEKFEYCWTDWE